MVGTGVDAGYIDIHIKKKLNWLAFQVGCLTYICKCKAPFFLNSCLNLRRAECFFEITIYDYLSRSNLVLQESSPFL